MRDVVVVAAARTPIGRLGGALASVRAVDLGAAAIRGALAQGRVDPADVDRAVLGHVLRAGQGQNPARQAAVRAGLPMTVPAGTVDRVCLSGMSAIAQARDLIRLGEADVVVAGGMESMSGAPHLLADLRAGRRLGDATLVDAMLHDGLTCAFEDCSMGLATERHLVALGLDLPRAAQDAWAARSHARAEHAARAGVLADEVVGVEVRDRRGALTLVDADEGVRPGTTEVGLAALAPAFAPDGSLTAGNASQLSDGAAAVVLASAERAAALGLPVLATITGHADVAGPDAALLLRPAEAIRAAAERAGVEPARFDLVEVNEAFAAVALASVRDLGLDEERVNVRGGAIALGHPIGASGARIVVTLVHALRSRGGGTGVAALCGGGGQGEALALSVG